MRDLLKKLTIRFRGGASQLAKGSACFKGVKSSWKYSRNKLEAHYILSFTDKMCLLVEV